MQTYALARCKVVCRVVFRVACRVVCAVDSITTITGVMGGHV